MRDAVSRNESDCRIFIDMDDCINKKRSGKQEENHSLGNLGGIYRFFGKTRRRKLKRLAFLLPLFAAFPFLWGALARSDGFAASDYSPEPCAPTKKCATGACPRENPARENEQENKTEVSPPEPLKEDSLKTDAREPETSSVEPARLLESGPLDGGSLQWEKDIDRAVARAKESKKMLLIYFRAENRPEEQSREKNRAIEQVSYSRDVRSGLRQDDFRRARPLPGQPHADQALAATDAQLCRRFENVLADESLRSLYKDYVPLEIPVDSPFFRQPEYAEMLSLPGLSIVDYRDAESPHFGKVVSVFPFLKRNIYTVGQVKTILTLPGGSLSQRSLIYAVRVHPDRPASTNSSFSEALAVEAAGHCEYMARIRVQGHQNFDARFHRLMKQLPGHMVSEVCAESWPGESVLVAAIECVRCWRLSSGHWRGVSGRNAYYSYDMRRGSNGVWYATGLFAN